MTVAEWGSQWTRLNQFNTRGDVDRDQLSGEWFAQLKHFHVDAVDHGITQLIGHAKDNFLPGLGLLKDFIQARLGRYDKTPGKCGSCGGSGWVDASPFKSNGLVYANTVARCQVCGIPAPQIEPSRREPLTELQQHEYLAGRYGRSQMPPGLEARHPDKPGNPELRQMIAGFRAKFANSQDELA